MDAEMVGYPVYPMLAKILVSRNEIDVDARCHGRGFGEGNIGC